MKQKIITWLLAVVMVLGLLTGCTSGGADDTVPTISAAGEMDYTDVLALDGIPSYQGEAYVVLNDNIPYFDTDGLTTEGYESYSPLDDLGRCGAAMANVGQETMPTEERGSISHVKPTGWQSVQYDNVDGKYLYNRCHLIGFQLTGENDNEENLITGTRYLNIEGMLPFENEIAEYVTETGNHVTYRVTPVFEGDNLLASGVLMEGYSVEDQGSGVSFCVYAYNVQPDIAIDYGTGNSSYGEPIYDTAVDTGDTEFDDTTTSASDVEAMSYVLNTSSKKFHVPDCSGVASMKESNRQDFTGSREELIGEGYEPCGICKP